MPDQLRPRPKLGPALRYGIDEPVGDVPPELVTDAMRDALAMLQRNGVTPAGVGGSYVVLVGAVPYWIKP